MKKKRKVTREQIEALLDREGLERHERKQRKLLERIAYHQAKIREEGREPLQGDSLKKLRQRIAYHEAKLEGERARREG